MSDLARVEKALRLAGERLLLGGGGQHGHWSGGLSEVASALVLLCDLPRELAEEIIEDFGLAQSFRGQGPPPHFRSARRASRQQPPQALSATPPVVVPCGQEVDLPDGHARIGSAVFTDDACHISVRYDGVPSWSHHGPRRFRGGGGPPSGPPQLTVTDDQGARADAHFGGGGSDEGWQGRWSTDRALSTTTRWLDLAGTRVDLGQSAPPNAVRIEALPEVPLVHRYLSHRLAAAEHGPPQEHDSVVDVLLELDVLQPDDPVLEEIAQVTAALHGGPYGGSAPRGLQPPWKGLLGRRHRDDGPTGDIPLAAATPEFDGTVVIVYDMRSEQHGFNVQARVMGEGAGMMRNPFHSSLRGVPLAWWAEDDRGNTYLGQWGGHGGNDGDISGDLNFHPPLDPKATRLTLTPTGLHHRAVIEIELPRWKEVS